MDRSDYIKSIRADGLALAEAARDRFRLPVPPTPGWNVADLVRHIGRVHHRVAARVRIRGQKEDSVPQPELPPDPELLEWYLTGVEELAEALAGADPAEPVWSWFTDQTAGFWQRRMAHETAVHRWDAQSASETQRPIATEIAADGIDEWFDVFLVDDDPALGGHGEAIRLARTDGPESWTVRLDPRGVRVERGEAGGTADVEVRATASDLLLLLWRRVRPEAVEVTGDREPLDRFLAALDLS